jgi:hypothetical protein
MTLQSGGNYDLNLKSEDIKKDQEAAKADAGKKKDDKVTLVDDGKKIKNDPNQNEIDSVAKQISS